MTNNQHELTLKDMKLRIGIQYLPLLVAFILWSAFNPDYNSDTIHSIFASLFVGYIGLLWVMLGILIYTHHYPLKEVVLKDKSVIRKHHWFSFIYRSLLSLLLCILLSVMYFFDVFTLTSGGFTFTQMRAIFDIIYNFTSFIFYLSFMQFARVVLLLPYGLNTHH